ncbi:hypothetical protein GCM10008904_23500 [Paraclostridium ghonii]|uniref:5-bromo-4-chloroindolyl phosphate hydrolysis protein n=1 Tax=Paraclostridium ghonii TaxID=29358 RepID=A0ABU0N3U4_9FIRM|nr:hypothetical protein [Paeniclostridium ghonii]MDQ0557795.1 5-bromo-4-chloroindolyl phosphate hydrolysis protein [Paeniclostridium ghonii]
MKLKKIILSLSVMSAIGVGSMGVIANANEKVVTNNETNYRQQNRQECSLTDEQQNLIEKGYNELTEDEKIIFDKYYKQSKSNLSQNELNECFSIHDKVYKYLGDEFLENIKQERSERLNNKHTQNGKAQARGICKQQ